MIFHIILIAFIVDCIVTDIINTTVIKYTVSNNVHKRNIPSHERNALYDLYISTHGDDWFYRGGDDGHWNFTYSDVNPCSSSDPWQGLNCTTLSSIYYVYEISLPDYNLQGTIPESIG